MRLEDFDRTTFVQMTSFDLDLGATVDRNQKIWTGGYLRSYRINHILRTLRLVVGVYPVWGRGGRGEAIGKTR